MYFRGFLFENGYKQDAHIFRLPFRKGLQIGYNLVTDILWASFSKWVTKWLQTSYMCLGALFSKMITKWLQTSYRHFRGFLLENGYKLVTCILKASFEKMFI